MEHSPLENFFDKGLKEDDKEEGILKRIGNIKDADEKQLQAIKDEHLKLVKRMKYEKPQLKSLRYQINKDNKEQLEYFDNLVKLELSMDYTNLY